MNPSLSKQTQKFHEWDAFVTAILLDLGYTIDNHWTRIWNVSEKNVR